MKHIIDSTPPRETRAVLGETDRGVRAVEVQFDNGSTTTCIAFRSRSALLLAASAMVNAAAEWIEAEQADQFLADSPGGE